MGPPKLVSGYRNALSKIVAGDHGSGMSRSHRTKHKKQLPYPPIERVTSPSQDYPPFSVVSQKNVYSDHPSSCSQGITCYSRTSTVVGVSFLTKGTQLIVCRPCSDHRASRTGDRTAPLVTYDPDEVTLAFCSLRSVGVGR